FIVSRWPRTAETPILCFSLVKTRENCRAGKRQEQPEFPLPRRLKGQAAAPPFQKPATALYRKRTASTSASKGHRHGSWDQGKTRSYSCFVERHRSWHRRGARPRGGECPSLRAQ